MMKTDTVISVFLFISMAFYGLAWKAGKTENRDVLITTLFDSYQSSVRPSEPDSDVTHVQQTIGIRKIIEYSDDILTLDGWTTFFWYDSRLKWPSENYGEIDHLVVPASSVWKPDIVLFNTILDPSSGIVDGDQRVWIGSDGSVAYYPRQRLKVDCGYQPPSEIFNCTLEFGSWTEGVNSINLTQFGNKVDLEVLEPSKEGEITLIHSEVSESLRNYVCCPEPFAETLYTLTFRRPSIDHTPSTTEQTISPSTKQTNTTDREAASEERVVGEGEDNGIPIQ